MQKMPPLNALRAFEVVARTGSFTRAARELGVSSAAVSQHVRNLEGFFGKQLFARSGNRLALTDAGHSVHAPTTRAFSDIAHIAGRLSEGEARPRLVVSVPYSLAEPWLAPRLSGLVAAHPHMAFDIRVEDDPIDVQAHRIDVRVAYGSYHYPDLTGIPLFHDEVLPVCQPAFQATEGPQDGRLDAVHESAFIHTSWGTSYASHPTWSDWFEHAGSRLRPDPSRGRRVGLSSLAVAAARSGLGIALAQRMLTHADLDAGRLVALASAGLKLGHPYVAFLAKGRTRRAELEALLEYLR